MNIINNIQDIKQSKFEYKKKDNNIQTSQIGYKKDVLDILSEKVVNKNDLKDMVTTPRAIFKGYLCFTAGTAINTIGSIIKKEKISNPLKIIGTIISIYGTYNFVKPYLIRNSQLTKKEK